MTKYFPWDLLPYNRSDAKDFDIGAITLPFQCHLTFLPKGIKRWLYGLGHLVVCLIGYWLLWLPFTIPFDIWAFLIFWGLGLVFAPGATFFLLHYIFCIYNRMTIRIDLGWVEVDDRQLFGRRRHWREPLSNYTGIRCHMLELQMGSELSWSSPVKYNVGAIDLDHPETDRIIPLLRTTQEGEVEHRWQAFAEALGKPMTGSIPSEIGVW